jgi:hypothetical protein
MIHNPGGSELRAGKSGHKQQWDDCQGGRLLYNHIRSKRWEDMVYGVKSLGRSLRSARLAVSLHGPPKTKRTLQSCNSIWSTDCVRNIHFADA